MFHFKDRLFQTKVKVASKFVFEDFDIGVLKNFRGFLKNFRSFVNIFLNFKKCKRFIFKIFTQYKIF